MRAGRTHPRGSPGCTADSTGEGKRQVPSARKQKSHSVLYLQPCVLLFICPRGKP